MGVRDTTQMDVQQEAAALIAAISESIAPFARLGIRTRTSVMPDHRTDLVEAVARQQGIKTEVFKSHMPDEVIVAARIETPIANVCVQSMRPLTAADLEQEAAR